MTNAKKKPQDSWTKNKVAEYHRELQRLKELRAALKGKKKASK